MTIHTASIFVELEIKVSATHVKGCPESHDPPSPAEPAGWEDITIEAISLPDGLPILSAPPWRNDLLSRQALAAAAMGAFLTRLEDEFSEEIEQALSDELPDGPDPDHARDGV